MKKVVDANVILRYLLDDHAELSAEAKKIISNEILYVPNEVIAEVVYVLEKVYNVPRTEISKNLKQFICYDNILVTDLQLLLNALNLYKTKRKLDIVDAILCSFADIKNYKVVTFDKEMVKYLSK